MRRLLPWIIEKFVLRYERGYPKIKGEEQGRPGSQDDLPETVDAAPFVEWLGYEERMEEMPTEAYARTDVGSWKQWTTEVGTKW